MEKRTAPAASAQISLPTDLKDAHTKETGEACHGDG